MGKVDSDIIIQIKKVGLKAIESLYVEWRNEFVKFGLRYTNDKEEILDVFQDALIVLYENVRDDKLTKLTSNLKTYVFGVGKFVLFNKLKKQSRLTEIDHVLDYDSIEVQAEEIITERQNDLVFYLEKMGGKCKEIIMLFYYEKRSIREIMLQTSLKNENTVKAHKSRCLKRLKLQMTEKYKL